MLNFVGCVERALLPAAATGGAQAGRGAAPPCPLNWPGVVTLSILAASVAAQTKPRARDLGVPFDGTPGPNNAITDVRTASRSGSSTLDFRRRQA